MPLDPSIILGVQNPQFANPVDLQNKAYQNQMLGMQTQTAQMQNQNMQRDMQNQQDLRSAYSQALTAGPDGTPTVDRPKLLAAIPDPMMRMNEGRKLQDQDAQMAKDQLETLKNQHEQAANLLSTIPDSGPGVTPDMQQAAWTKANQAAVAAGFPGADKAPQQYPGDQFKANALLQLQSGQAQLDFKQKTQELAIKHEENSIKRAQMVGDRDNKDAESLDKHLSLGWTARSGQAGVVQGKIVSAEAAQALLEQAKTQPGGLDSRQIEELAQNTGKLLGGGTAASARVDALVPHTLMGKAQTLQEFLTNNPTGANQQAFVARMADTIAREKDLANNQKMQFQIEGLPSHARLKNSNPNLYNSILQSKGIDPSVIDEKGKYKAPAVTAVSGHPQDAQALDWAKANPTDPRSAAILKLNSGGQ